ncbi:MAG: phosphoribosylformylglycinamidine synthase subunit PurS [Flavobacteriales bacterium]|jgi:phosphoribosylformylglycinamidine synthase PurS subunit|tara:strand:+ start:806 stop:1057 length:252 start_codon:yes stop_codon:yes gene_type:complete
MIFKAEIDIMPLEAILDPQGKAVTQSMGNLGLNEITNVRIGKHITLKVDAADEATAKNKVDEACKNLLCNMIMESYTFILTKA